MLKRKINRMIPKIILFLMKIYGEPIKTLAGNEVRDIYPIRKNGAIQGLIFLNIGEYCALPNGSRQEIILKEE